MTVEEKIEQVFNNEEVLKNIFEAETPVALMQVMNDNGVVFEDVTAEQVFAEFQKAKNGELSEDELDDVNGGVYLAVKAGAFYVAVAGGSVAGALCVAGGVALIGLATYAGYRYIRRHW